MTYALAYIDAGIDYPEEGVTEDNYDVIKTTLTVSNATPIRISDASVAD